MKLAITGGTGLVGRFLVQEALGAGDDVTVLSRTPPAPGFFSHPIRHIPYDLNVPPPPLDGVDALIHAAFRHVPGRYRGGEGDDPAAFLRANLDGSLALFEAARSAGLSRLLFVSSRAVYGDYAPGTSLREDMSPRPDTLYGEAKLQAEQALASLASPVFNTASLRATGVYGPAGPGQVHKWTELFADALAGRPVGARVATEVHGQDLAAAARLLLRLPAKALGGAAFNVSDLVLDRHDLLSEVAKLSKVRIMPPDRADAAQVSNMQTERLRSLGWTPGGMERLRRALPAMLSQAGVPFAR